MLDNIIGVEEAGRVLGFVPGTVKNMCATGKLRAKKVGKTWVLDKTNLEVIKMMKLYYEDVLVGEVTTNRSVNVEEALELIGFDEEVFLKKQGWDELDYNEFRMVW